MIISDSDIIISTTEMNGSMSETEVRSPEMIISERKITVSG
jgi:hypothetical protein